MSELIEIQVRACVVNPGTGVVEESATPSSELKPHLFGIYFRPVQSMLVDWHWCADVEAYPYVELFVNALCQQFQRSGVEVRMDLTAFNHFKQ